MDLRERILWDRARAKHALRHQVFVRIADKSRNGASSRCVTKRLRV
jgi:hypothetical protein